MADEKKFSVSVSIVPATVVEFAGKPNGTLSIHMAVDETIAGDSRPLVELKASYSRVTVENAKPLFDALSPFVGVKKDLTADQMKEVRSKLVSVISDLEHLV